ncbi:MAG TPA: sugar phosphate isomerase/epimerase [Candidatus Limiplasma sp.]|nr:sugar phosphate isomerase/epimerase [Candidatus Limiplasma sp.]
MKLSVFGVVLGQQTLDEACDYLEKRGVHAMEVGCGGFPGKAHCDPEVLLHDEGKLKEFSDTFKRHHIEIAALSVHGNPVHPDPQQAKMYHDDFVNAVLLAEKLGVKRIVGFSGCPGGSAQDKTPNWVTCPWPPDFSKILEYQWNEVLIPYWKKTIPFANEHGIEKIALEMHPGFCVYNPSTLLRLRKAVGNTIGANFDPSHLYWQGMDPVMAIRELGDAIYFFHAKDTKLDPVNIARNGVLDVQGYGKINERSWVFRTVGYGHSTLEWNSIVSELRINGYDDVISIEHEDGLMSGNEGLSKAIRFLQQVLMTEDPGEMYWA